MFPISFWNREPIEKTPCLLSLPVPIHLPRPSRKKNSVVPASLSLVPVLFLCVYGCSVMSTGPALVEPLMVSDGDDVAGKGKKRRSPWRQGLCQCCHTPSLCMLSWCCCFQQAALQARFDGHWPSCFLSMTKFCLSHVCFPPLSWVSAAQVRTQMRERYSLEGSRLEDALIVWCLPCCALVQQSAEVEARTGRRVHCIDCWKATFCCQQD